MFQRIKTRISGLGKLNPDHLWETATNLRPRILLQFKVQDMLEADEIVTTLMGDQDSRRRKFSTNSFSDVHHLSSEIVRQDLQAKSTAQGN